MNASTVDDKALPITELELRGRLVYVCSGYVRSEEGRIFTTTEVVEGFRRLLAQRDELISFLEDP